tara:strand:- start:5813 stop:5995 length:183 start_codon:yes stop_codon:yes gene_type:complete
VLALFRDILMRLLVLGISGIIGVLVGDLATCLGACATMFLAMCPWRLDSPVGHKEIEAYV